MTAVSSRVSHDSRQQRAKLLPATLGSCTIMKKNGDGYFRKTENTPGSSQQGSIIVSLGVNTLAEAGIPKLSDNSS